ncbi:beta-galactosidase [Tamaricihabitans halophyticus]|uniref:Beta-galactosidase n=1 Tax=Tamaricihabitans halophyticus TaxID=1262583 RepID=A0A4R2R3S2_9PSEU|nr:glycoside hydrolase family 2 TIM barrel-domain containing protein [Tamaricihabitans halophyticus]TCP54181.1 beta-galactosidase [Tamaricihabitans halophyticus]
MGRTSLNPEWQFTGPILNPLEATKYTGRFELINLPHTVTPLSWHDWNPASWEGFWLYRKEFDLSEPARRQLLRFAGAMTGIRPFLNSVPLSPHIGGYLPAEYEITNLVRETGNRLDVVVDGRWAQNVPPNRPGRGPASIDLWQPAGLYRDVTLESLPANYLADVFARPRDVLDPVKRCLEVTTTIDVTEPETEAELIFELRADDGPVLRHTEKLALPTPGTRTVRHTLRGLPGDLALWSPDRPALHHLSVTLRGASSHTSSRTIGFRQVEFTATGCYVNGERLQIRGSGRHHYFPFTGSAMPARVQRRDALILKEHGHNMVRCTVYPQDESFLDACDELGLLVYAEAPGWGYLGDVQWQDRSARDVHDMIRRDRNHPSIVLWGVRLNETRNDTEFYTRTQRIARELDDSRQTTGAIIAPMHDISDFQQDVFSYNDYHRGKDGYPELRAPRTEWPYLVSEAVGTLSGPAKFYRRTDPVADQQVQAVCHAMVHDQALADERYCGVLGWATFDYQSGNGNQRDGIKSPGIFDMFREPKLGAAIYTAQVDPAHRLVIQPACYWDFGTRFGVAALDGEAVICSNAEQLELFLDDEPYRLLHPARDRYPNLPYPPFLVDLRELADAGCPELRIDAYRAGEFVGSRTFSADREQDQFYLAADDAELSADGSDATRIVLRIVDKYGGTAPPRAGLVRFSLDGPAILLGDHPFPLGDTGGVGAVWLRSQYRQSGVAVLRAEHDTLGARTVRVHLRGA